MQGFQYTNYALDFFPYISTALSASSEDHVKALPADLGGGTSYDFNYVFTHTDHLGNIRVKYTRHPQTGEIQILEEDHYYPYGLTHKGYSENHQTIGFDDHAITLIDVTPDVTDTYKYKFNGMEYQDEFDVNLYDFGARNYDPALGRWMNVDPMAHERESLTSYNFCSNNPINRVDPDGALDDWVQNIETGEYEWMDNVTSADNTPEGYRYVGSQDADILKDLGVSYSFPEQSSNRLGYVAADVEMGRYAVNHLINVKAKSNISISADVSYNLLGGTENNRLGKRFEGIKVSSTVIGSNSGADGTVNAYSNLTIGYGGKTYTAGMGEPQLPYLKQTGTSVAVGSVNIPASNLSRSYSFSGVSVSGGWWVTNSANMRIPVVYHPLTPVPQTFKHSWTFPKR